MSKLVLFLAALFILLGLTRRARGKRIPLMWYMLIGVSVAIFLVSLITGFRG